jgi:hypothetical protein
LGFLWQKIIFGPVLSPQNNNKGNPRVVCGEV